MATNQYHLLHTIPAVEAWEMPPALEALAQRLVRSGLLRINADHERNFVRLGTADTDRTFTARELTDAQLAPRTRQILARHVPPAAGPEAVEELQHRLLSELKKARGIAPEKEMNVARVVVQAAHPSVMVLLLQSGTPLYVSYSHSVADLLAVHDWQSLGDAGGLQATSTDGAAVYISCGGDPFFAGEHKTYRTDGFPALARMMIIGGQELGHYADLKREGTRILGRYSTDDRSPYLRADPAVRTARRADMARVAALDAAGARAGLGRLARAEQTALFYAKRRRYLAWLFAQCWRCCLWLLVHRRGPALRFRVHPALGHGTAFATFVSDMAFNLAPDAAAYRRPDPEEEEAIACIEALARVPQQVHKWGHANVAAAWPGLTAIYDQQVIPGCIRAAGVAMPDLSLRLSQRLFRGVRRRLRTRPQYYPTRDDHIS